MPGAPDALFTALADPTRWVAALERVAAGLD
jgi:hypothetical protein